MAELTPEQQAVIAQRTAGLPDFLDDARRQLLELGQAMGLDAPHLLIAEPINMITTLSPFFATDEIDEENMTWLTVCLGTYVGEVLIERAGGLWSVNDNADSRLVGRYVISNFEIASREGLTVDPFEVAGEHLRTPPPRPDLAPLIESIAESIAS